MAAAVVQLAIGVVFVFLLVGSACSFLNEVVAAVLDRRAAHLERWLRKMLGDDAEKFLSHPLISELRRPRSRKELAVDQPARASSVSRRGKERRAEGRGLKQRRVPSYVSSATFATTLLSILSGTRDDEPQAESTTSTGRTSAGGRAAGSRWARVAGAVRKATRTAKRQPTTPSSLGGVRSSGALATRIDSQLEHGPLRAVLQTLLADANGQVDEFRGRLEGWFGEEMDRLSGWYKRRTKWFLFLWGLGLAVVLNVDALLLVKTLWNDNTLRSTVVAQAEQAAGAAASGAPSTLTTTLPCPIAPEGAQPGASTTTAPDPLDCVAARIETLQSLQLPIGWPGWPLDAAVYRGTDRRTPHSPGDWMLKALGLLVIAAAATQGGPFWFDLLGKFVNLRMTGPPPSPPPSPPPPPAPGPASSPPSDSR